MGISSRLSAAVMLRRRFRPSRLGAAVIAMISPASGVWTLLFDDLSLRVLWGWSWSREDGGGDG